MTGIVGAVLAGGLSRRFGSDKALAIVDGVRLLDHAIHALQAVTPHVVVCGRAWPPILSLADRPAAGMGPLSGLNAALHHARDNGFDWVVTLACDTPFVSEHILTALIERQSASYVEAHPVIGLWPATAADALDQWLGAPGKHSMRGWARSIGAEAWDCGAPIDNFNHAGDLDRWLDDKAERVR